MWTGKSRGTTRNIIHERKSVKEQSSKQETFCGIFLPRGNMGFWTLYHGSASI